MASPSPTGTRSVPRAVERATALDVPPRWPAAVRSELERLGSRLTARIPRGSSVLDLSVPEGRSVLSANLPRLGVPGVAPPEVSYDHIVSVAGLVRFPDLFAALSACDRLLAPGGTLWLLEPTGRPDAIGVAIGTIGALQPTARGTHLNRDVTAALREAGFVTPDLDRLRLPTTVLSLRRFVMARAQRPGEAVG